MGWEAWAAFRESRKLQKLLGGHALSAARRRLSGARGLLVMGLVLLLTACGGGSSGGDSGAQAGLGGTQSQALRFVMDVGEATPPQRIEVALPARPGVSYADVRAGPGLQTEWSLSPAGVIVTVTPLWGSPVGENSYVEVRQCADTSCADVRHTQRVSVVVVQPRGLEVAGRGTKYMAVALGKRLADRGFSLTLPDEPGTLSISVADNAGRPVSWLQATQKASELVLAYAGSESLPAGRFGAVVDLRYDRSNGKAPATWRVGVNIEVGEPGCRLVNAPPEIAQTIYGPDRWINAITLWPVSMRCYGAYADQVHLTSPLTGLTLTSRTSDSLLSDLDITATLSIEWVANQLANLQTHQIGWTARAIGLPDFDFSTTIQMSVPEIRSVDPSRVAAGQAREVLLTGVKLSSSDNPLLLEGVGEISYRTTNCDKYPALFQCDLIASLPALPAGRYTFNLRSHAVVKGHQPVVVDVGP